MYCEGSSPLRRSSREPRCENRRALGLGSCGLMPLARPVRSVGGAGDLSAPLTANRAPRLVEERWKRGTDAASAMNHKLPCSSPAQLAL